jgi:uncharacterized protein with HEPN domain
VSAKDPLVYLAHARDCADRIESYAVDGKACFLADPKTRDAILRNLEIIGQCVKDAGVDPLASLAPTIQWTKIAAFRNVLAHSYLSVKPEVVWTIVEVELPPQRRALEKMLDGWQP